MGTLARWMKRSIINGNGYGDADEVSFAAMATTPDFLGSLSSRDEKMDAYHGKISRNGGSRETERKRR